MKSVRIVDALLLMYPLSLDMPVKVDEYGNILTWADIIPDHRQDVEAQAIARVLLESVPPEILRIGQKRVDGEALSPAERKRLERFRKRNNNHNSKEVNKNGYNVR